MREKPKAVKVRISKIPRRQGFGGFFELLEKRLFERCLATSFFDLLFDLFGR